MVEVFREVTEEDGLGAAYNFVRVDESLLEVLAGEDLRGRGLVCLWRRNLTRTHQILTTLFLIPKLNFALYMY